MCGYNDRWQETGACVSEQDHILHLSSEEGHLSITPTADNNLFNALPLKKRNETHISGLIASHALDKPVFLNKTNSSPNIKK